MKHFFSFILMLGIFISCVENTVDSMQSDNDSKEGTKTLRERIMHSRTSGTVVQMDSLKMVSIAQSDLNTMMMNQICQKDSIFILAISRTDAISLGVSDELYDHYVGYVARLNEQLAEIR